jgi:mediator of RNA polymerase II transcription subunit 5
MAELWMKTVIIAGPNPQELMSLAQGNREQEIANTTMALGTLVVSVLYNQQVLKSLSQGCAPKGTGTKLSATLENFMPFLGQSSPQNVARLEAFRTQTLATIEPLDKKEIAASKEIDEMLGEGIELGIGSVVAADLPTMNSRAGLYIYLNSLVSTPKPNHTLCANQFVACGQTSC